MTDREKISQLEDKVERLERQIDFINKRFQLAPDQDALAAIIDDMITCRKTKAQNAEALGGFLERGGRLS